MIYGEIKDISIYKGISKNLDKAIEYIAEKKYLVNKFGKNEIDGDVIYFNCPEKPMTREVLEVETLEYHKRYIDIHIVIEGEEKIGYTPFDECEETKSFDKEGDYALMAGKIKTNFYLDKNKFLILFPMEPHIALLSPDKPKEIKKVIFKVEF